MTTRTTKQPPLCKDCFPDGPPEGATSVGCEHGTWTVTPKASSKEA